ncbi:universal stress protein [Haladaptatus sp. GCM10025707]|uniref:universal stress protein n=1 Tax=unclassified Haladaptatus TaxID=2622732 RepID=UPI0023E7DE4A|nr:universal stress protein [Haladaptatus sp. QDMS2]
MVLLVPFDGSALAETALRRGAQFARVLDRDLVALVVLPDDEAYAQERGWANGDGFDKAQFAETLRERVEAIAPEAKFRVEHASDPDDEPYSSVTMNIVRTVRKVATEVDADIIFIGSENAGRVSQPLSSVGAPVSADPRYDVHIVRHAD